jgi:hypothetical protein
MLSCFVLSCVLYVCIYILWRCVLYVCIYMGFTNLAASARAAAACSSISTCPPRSRSTELLILNKKVGEPVLLQPVPDKDTCADSADDVSDHVNKAASSNTIGCISNNNFYAGTDTVCGIPVRYFFFWSSSTHFCFSSFLQRHFRTKMCSWAGRCSW